MTADRRAERRAPRSSVSPDAVIKQFSAASLKKAECPAWIVVEWEESYLLKTWMERLWDTLKHIDPEVERVHHYPSDAAGMSAFLEELGNVSLFSSTRLVIAHLARGSKRFLRADAVAGNLAALPPQMVVVFSVEGMGWIREDVEQWKKKMGSASGRGVEISIWKPFPERIESFAREILSALGLRADSETIRFWLDRVGSNLERLQAEAVTMGGLSKDRVVTQELLEQTFEEPHVHEKSMWVALKLLLTRDPAAPAELERLAHSSDAQSVASRISHTLMCVQALAGRSSGDKVESPERVLARFDIKGKRRQQLYLETANLLNGPLPALSARLLEMDLRLKQAKTPACRQEVLVRKLLALCNEPEPAA